MAKNSSLSKSNGSHKKDYPPSLQHRIRVRLTCWVCLLMFSMVIGRLFYVHISPKWHFSEEDLSHLGIAEIQLARGEILDIQGRILATDRQTPSLWADPSRVKDPETVAHFVASRLQLDENMLYRRLTQKRDDDSTAMFVWMKRWLTPAEESMLGPIDALTSMGLRIRQEPTRFYPQGATACHILGFVNRERVASEGIERTFDPYLNSTPGRRVAAKDGRRTLISSLTFDYEPATGGDSVYLTIDVHIQRILEQELDVAIAQNKADHAMGIIVDPNTGAIIAMASRPGFDPNQFNTAEPGARANRAVLDTFEPGSVFKVFPVAAALDSGWLSPDEPVNCEGGIFYPYARRSIKDVHRMGVVSFREAFAQSSNIAMVKLAANRIGEENLADWIRRFGFGERASDDFPVQSPGIVHPLQSWSRASLVSLAIGQEISMTLLQLARGYSAIANGGILPDLYIVDHAVSPSGEITYQREPAEGRRILQESTAELMRELCHHVVTHGTGKRANIPEYRAGGKTGTAQIARATGGGYYADKYNAIFVGFAPVNQPRLVSAIIVNAPSAGSHYGGYVCGPVFRRVMRRSLVHLGVPEDPVLVPVTAPPDPVYDADILVARSEPDPLELPDDFILASLDDLEYMELHTLPKISPAHAYDGTGLRSYIGMTKAEARDAILKDGIQWSTRGSGWVVYQDPQPGTPLNEVSVCRLVFSSKEPAHTIQSASTKGGRR